MQEFNTKTAQIKDVYAHTTQSMTYLRPRGNQGGSKGEAGGASGLQHWGKRAPWCLGLWLFGLSQVDFVCF